MRYVYLAVALCTAVPLIGCGGFSETIQTRESGIKTQKAKKRSIDNKINAYKRYRSGLAGKGGTYLAVGRAEILESIKVMTPYKIPGSKLWPKRLSGTVTLKNPRDLKILSGARVQYVIDFKGTKIKVNLKGTGASASHEKKLREALEGGGTATVVASVSVDHNKNRMVVRPKATSVSLRKHNTGENRRRLKGVVNKRIFSGGKPMSLPKPFRSKKTRILSSKNHVILIK